jgi:hypothetical protein
MVDDCALRPLGGDGDAGGDAACWLARVCDACGALVEAPLPAVCWRCGADVVAG